MRRRRLVVAVAAVLVLGAGASAAGIALSAEPPRPPADTSQSASPSAAPSATPVAAAKPKSFFDKTRLSIDDPNSLWVVGDKLRPLNPVRYVPPDLVTANVPYSANAIMRAEAAAAMETMFAAAEAEGAGRLMLQNAYRSYDSQVNVHGGLVGRLGKEKARAQSAVPGYSEHQTGLSADIMSSPQQCSIQACFGTTPQGMWLAENAWRFGYHLRYPEGKTDVTGYVYEPWHYRYVGPELAAELRATGTATLEEFFGLPPAPDYPSGV